LYALRAFEAAARHSSFTRAAEELSITQSAVSRHIRTLEEHFACRLFQRSGRNLQLTEAARMLLPGVREGFAALERACNTLRAEDDILRMKAPSTLTMRWLLARLSRFLQPGNEVQLTSAWMDVDGGLQPGALRLRGVLSDGHFPADWEAAAVPELLIPVGAPNLLDDGPGMLRGWPPPNCCTPRPTGVTGATGWSAWGCPIRCRSRAGRCSIPLSWA
jgi:DNA-binding transcriptional LysR family regulator